MTTLTAPITADPYMEFLRRKAALPAEGGFPCELSEVHPLLKGHQSAIVVWAVRGGQRAIFSSFGTGKSLIQVETVRLTLKKSGGRRGLIICPFGARREIAHDAAIVGVETTFVRFSKDITGDGIYLTNYESVRDGRLDVSLFDVVSLDEAAVLRSYGSKTYQTFLTLFEAVPYRFVATATPSPNRLKEIIHYAGFLGIMDTGQALTRFFQRDSTQANNLTLYPHKVEEFWLWVSSWAVMLMRPSDLGFSDAGYDLPEVKVFFHEIPATSAFGSTETNGQTTILADSSLSLPAAAREKRGSLDARIAKMQEIINSASENDHWLLWHTLEDERKAISQILPGAAVVFGTQDEEAQEDAISGFSEGQYQFLAAKPVMLGAGSNLQKHCHKAIYVGTDYKGHDFMQSVHRIQRFGQAHPCEIHLIYTEAEREVVKTLMAKWETHKEMQERMSALIKEHGLSSTDTLAEKLTRSIGVDRVEASGKNWRLVNNDAVLEAQRLEGDSLGLVLTSIPFANHYEYSANYSDMGHTDNNGHFWEQMDFLTPELLRALSPGRMACIHVKDRILFGNVTGKGNPTVSPFHCEAINHYMKHGFDYMGLIVIATDVVRENNQTYRLGYSKMLRDRTAMGVGSPEFVILMRKPQTDRSRGWADKPVSKSREDYSLGRWQVDADAIYHAPDPRYDAAYHAPDPRYLATLTPGQLAKTYTEYTKGVPYSYDDHVQIAEELQKRNALPSSFKALAPASHDPHVWTDIQRMQTLNGSQAAKGKEMHICPLQLGIVDRLIFQFSDEGDLVYDPFMGIGTVARQSILAGRCAAGSELNKGYWQDSLCYVREAEAQMNAPTLFSLEDFGEAPFAPPDPVPAGELTEALA